jgi:hypothetical protein
MKGIISPERILRKTSQGHGSVQEPGTTDPWEMTLNQTICGELPCMCPCGESVR